MLAVFLDIETTGLDPKIHRTIDIALKVVDCTTEELVESYQSVVKQPFDEWKYYDPVSLKINGYTWEVVQSGKERWLVAEELEELFQRHDIVRGRSLFICQNPAFDRTFLTQLVSIGRQEELKWPYHWLDLASMHWALLLDKCRETKSPFPKEMTLSKNEIAELLGLAPEETPHRAMSGVDHLIACYEALLRVKFKLKSELIAKERS